MTRIDVKKLNWPVDSWRADAYDPEHDDPAYAPPRKQNLPIELLPGVWVYPEFFNKPNAYLINEAEWDDLGSDDWA